MKKLEQIEINKRVELAKKEFDSMLSDEGIGISYKLRTCTADVYRVGHFWALRSYSTTIAIIDTTTDTLYDFLRKVYGYTATSAQHINKFSKDYGTGKWGCTHTLTYRYI